MVVGKLFGRRRGDSVELGRRQGKSGDGDRSACVAARSDLCWLHSIGWTHLDLGSAGLPLTSGQKTHPGNFAATARGHFSSPPRRYV